MIHYDIIQEKSLLDSLATYYGDFSILKRINQPFSLSLDQKVLLEFKEGLLQLKDKKVLIVGDYDCDGIISTTILKCILKFLNIDHNHYIPSRFKEGYGINKGIVDRAFNAKFDAIITIDNGIVANEVIDYAKTLNIKTYIIDHHEYETLPNADYILHSFLLDKEYRNACASGLAYLLSRCFFKSDRLLAYASIATMADMMEVFDYNRYLIKEGLNALNTNCFDNINAISGKQKYEYEDIHYTITPKINALSRLNRDKDVNEMVHYLLLEDKEVIYDKAKIIQEINTFRKTYSEKMFETAKTYDLNQTVIMLSDTSFQEGLTGLLASKLVNEYQKISFVFAYNASLDVYKGSGRSIADFDLYRYLKESNCSFTQFGGHKMAVGLTLSKDEYEALKQYVQAYPPIIQESNKKCIHLNEEALNEDLLVTLETLKPFGTGFEEPLFFIKEPTIINTYMIKQKYPKYTIHSKAEAISFKHERLNTPLYFVGYVHPNHYRKNGITFQIEDCK